MLSKQEIYKRGVFFKVCNVLPFAQCMAKDMGQGSDMQGTPPRELTVFNRIV